MSANEVARLLAAADAAMSAGQRDAAFANLEAALELDAANPRILNSLGLRALHSGDAVRAVALLERAVAADPEAPPLWYNLATAHRATGDDLQEEAALDQALGLDNFMLPAFIAKAQLVERRGEIKNAIILYQRLLLNLPPMDKLPSDLAAAIEHGRDLVQKNSVMLTERIDRALVDPRARTAPSDLKRFDQAVDIMLGRRKLYHNEPAGLHFPYLPAIQFFERSQFDWLPRIEAATIDIRNELLALLDVTGPAGEFIGFDPYVAYPPEVPPRQWSELNHSDRWAARFLYKYGVPQGDMLAKCPRTAAAIDSLPLISLPGRAPSVFFSLLRPQTRIPPHTGVSNIRVTCHLPLIVPPNCGFRVGSETREWEPGKAFVFDDTIEHEAWNNSSQLRAILIFDVWNPYLTEAECALLQHLFAAADIEQDPFSRFDAG